MFEENTQQTFNAHSYQELINNLEFIQEKVKLPNDFDVSILGDKYDHCHRLISHLHTEEIDDTIKEALQELAAVFRWQKKHVTLMTEKKRSVIKTKTNLSESQTEDDSRPRRQMVLNTIVPRTGVALKDVAGLTEAKLILREALILPLNYPHLFSGIRKTWTRLLLYGPPGTGKSRLAMAISSEINSTLFSISSADLMSSWVGESEKMVKELFHCARENDGYSLIFIDEIDSIGRRRTSNEDDHIRRVKTELLKQMDGIDSESKKVFLLCATNCPWELDPAFLRRFHKRIYVSLPDRSSRMEILRLHTKETTVTFTDNDWKLLLDSTEGYSGSDIATLAMTALLIPIRQLQSATFWALTPGGSIIPCLTGNDRQATIRCKLEELPADKVVPRDVTVSDFVDALATCQRTVSGHDLHQFEEFTRQYGQLG